MTDLGPINMKQHLKDQAKLLARMERGMGGLLRPKSGVPSYPTGVALSTSGNNDLSRYGSRLTVFAFALTVPSAPVAGQVLANLPTGFIPAANVPFAGWAGTGPSAVAALLYLGSDGALRFNSAAVSATTFLGTVTFTAAP